MNVVVYFTGFVSGKRLLGHQVFRQKSGAKFSVAVSYQHPRGCGALLAFSVGAFSNMPAQWTQPLVRISNSGAWWQFQTRWPEIAPLTGALCVKVTILKVRFSKYEFPITASLLTLFAVIAMFKSSNEPVIYFLQHTVVADFLQQWNTGNTIIFNLSLGYLVSVMFWVIVVAIPEFRRRKIFKNNLSTQYRNFKEDIIGLLLKASGGSHDFNLLKRLCDYREFKEYFNNENWYAALNGLQVNDALLNDVIVEIEILANEIAYILNNVDINNSDVFAFLKRLSYHVYRLKNSSVYSDDQVKYFGSFLWEILARWSFVDGQRKEDIVEVMINQL